MIALTGPRVKPLRLGLSPAGTGSLGDHTDPGDLDHIHRRRAERLKQDAEGTGFSTEITAFSRRDGGLVGYVRRLQDEVEFRHKHGDI